MQFLRILNKYIHRKWELNIWEKIGMQWWAAGGRLFLMVLILAILSFQEWGVVCAKANP